MNEELREQLKHPKARQRHEAIVQLARLKDEDVLPLLNDISKNDPEPELRQLAERAIIHILNEFSSTISRAQSTEEPPLSSIPPFSNPEAEKYIQKAFELYESGSTANALQYLIRALDLTPMLVGDFDVQLLAENLTGIEGTIAAKMLTDREKRNQFFDDASSSSGTPPIKPSSLIIFVLFMVVMSKFFLADSVEMINQALDELSVQQIKQSAQEVNGTAYYMLAPNTTATENGYPVLIAIPDGQENTSAMLRHFSDFANSYGAILLIPEFTDYRFALIEDHTSIIQAMMDRTAEAYQLDDAGAVLFGFGNGATIATQFANQYPEQTAHVITSGGTFLYPPSDDTTYTIVYGAEDELLHGLTSNYAPFADLTEWKIPLNFLTIENIGHEINSQQIDITKQILLDVYQ